MLHRCSAFGHFRHCCPHDLALNLNFLCFLFAFGLLCTPLSLFSFHPPNLSFSRKVCDFRFLRKKKITALCLKMSKKSHFLIIFQQCVFFLPISSQCLEITQNFIVNFFVKSKLSKDEQCKTVVFSRFFFQQNNFTIFHVKSKLCKPVAFSQNLK